MNWQQIAANWDRRIAALALAHWPQLHADDVKYLVTMQDFNELLAHRIGIQTHEAAHQTQEWALLLTGHPDDHEPAPVLASTPIKTALTGTTTQTAAGVMGGVTTEKATDGT